MTAVGLFPLGKNVMNFYNVFKREMIKGNIWQTVWTSVWESWSWSSLSEAGLPSCNDVIKQTRLSQSCVMPTHMQKCSFRNSTGLTGTQMRFSSSANWVICGSGTKYNIIFYMNKYQAGQPSIPQPSCQVWQLIIKWLDMVGELGLLDLQERRMPWTGENKTQDFLILTPQLMRWEEQEMKNLTQTLRVRHKGGYVAVTKCEMKMKLPFSTAIPCWISPQKQRLSQHTQRRTALYN